MSVRVVGTVTGDDGSVLLVSPGVGEARDLVPVGDVVVGGRVIGGLEVLGVTEALVMPPGLQGRVVERLLPAKARFAVGYGTPLLRIDPRSASVVATIDEESVSERAATLVFRASMSGRFYARVSPTKPPLVEVGDIIETGHGVCLLEVMKTFNRVSYGGEGLPARARVARIVPGDGDDVARGAVLLELQAVDGSSAQREDGADDRRDDG